MKHFTYSALLLIVLITGCATTLLPRETVLLTQCRYGEMEQLMESRISNMATAPTSQLFYLCFAYSKLKHYNKLFPCAECLQRNIDRGDKTIFTLDYSGIPAMLLAEAWMEFGDYEKAVVEADRANRLTRIKRDNPQFKIYALTVAALSRALAGDRMGAERFADELEAIYVPTKLRTLTSDKYIGLAKIYMALGNYQGALKTIMLDKERWFDPFTAILIGQEFFTFWELPKQYILNKSMLETGDLAGAKAGYDQLLQMQQTKQNGDIYWLILFDRGRIAEAEGNREQAIELYRKAIEVIEQQRSTINTETSKIGFVGNKQEVYGFLVEQLLEVGRLEEAFEYVERAKARALVDMLASKKRFVGGERGESTQLTALLEDLDEAEMENLVQDYQISPQQHAATRSIVVQLKNKISRTSPELASLVTVTPLDVAEIQQLLPSDETLVEYFGTKDTLYVFIVDRNGIRGIKLDVPGLNRKIDAFRKHIMNPGSDQFKGEGQALYKKLIHPLEGMITSKNLTIVPHGALHYLPFNALSMKEGFLIDRYNIRVLPSASVMKFLKDRREGHVGNLLAFGNPDLGDPTYDLPGAQNEAIAITKDQPKSKLFIRKQATETAVKRFGEQFRYIHFATHGTFDAEKPLSSGLLMTGDGENDGTLTVGELYDLRLPADLVTLSACETALGKVANGDDVVGFTRGFLYAGVSSIVSSLWKVDDQATSILMQQFYASLKESDKRNALRAAQLKVKNTYNSHPYFWAAFQITGAVQ